jgi:hypothetical protein
MADNSPAGRIRALKRSRPVSFVFLALLVAVLIATGEGKVALMVAVFGVLTGFAVYDAVRCRLELERYRQEFGALPDSDDR